MTLIEGLANLATESTGSAGPEGLLWRLSERSSQVTAPRVYPPACSAGPAGTDGSLGAAESSGTVLLELELKQWGRSHHQTRTPPSAADIPTFHLTVHYEQSL